MHVISKRPFNDAAKVHPNHRQALEDLYRVLRKSEFSSPDEMRHIFPSLDNFKYKDKWWVIDVAGNHLRVIAFIQFVHNRMYVKHILTHAEYDKLCNRYARGELK
ncbi:MAG: type II toxin-antitoxin system HigB family toxin [Gammaproteobacteria bacterium]|nr:MAG: type II toxin-antitoxin system HigB family toxin [Gammaproteobacteria bacterium]